MSIYKHDLSAEERSAFIQSEVEWAQRVLNVVNSSGFHAAFNLMVNAQVDVSNPSVRMILNNVNREYGIDAEGEAWALALATAEYQEGLDDAK